MAVLGAQRWTSREDALVCASMPRTAAEVAVVAGKLGRSASAVRSRVRRFRGRVARRWKSDEDRELLSIKLCPHTERHAGDGSFARIAAKFGVTEQTTRDRYDRLARKAGHRGGQWTDEGLWTREEDEAIRSAMAGHRRVPNGTWPEVADALGRTLAAVRTRACALRRLDGTADR